MITTIVLDWGGVLNLTGHASLISKQIQAKYGIEYMTIIEAIVPLWKKLNRNMILFDELVAGVNSQLNISISEAEMMGFLKNSFDINEELVSLLAGLKPRYSLMMLSNNNKSLVDAIRQARPEIYSLFDKHYYSYELGLRKPDVKIFEKFLEDSGLDPEKCVLIDDSEENITVSERLGIKGILFKDNNALRQSLSHLGIL